MLTSGASANELDDKFRLGESTSLKCLQRFCQALIDIYSKEALRSPNVTDLHRLLDEGNAAGWPGCIGSIDCMHIRWKNCPYAWAGMFTGKEGAPTVVLEAVADHSDRIWHFFFGCPGSLNDPNVLDRSNLLHGIINGSKHTVRHGHEYLLPGSPTEYTLSINVLLKRSAVQHLVYSSISRKSRKRRERMLSVPSACSKRGFTF